MDRARLAVLQTDLLTGYAELMNIHPGRALD